MMSSIRGKLEARPMGAVATGTDYRINTYLGDMRSRFQPSFRAPQATNLMCALFAYCIEFCLCLKHVRGD